MSLHAPDIYVVPPAEDSAAPWCCYNSHNSVPDPDGDDDDDSQSAIRYIQASHLTPYFHRTMPGSDALVLPSRKPSTDTQSIVDALGDADDFTDDEPDQGPMDVVPEEGEEDGDLGYELGVAHEFRPSPEPHSEVGNDSDIIEVFKVRRRSMRAAHTYNDLHGALGSPTEFNKSSLRFRATKAFLSLRGAVRPSPTFSNAEDSSNTIATSNTKLKSALKPRTKLQPRPRVQDIINPIENTPQTEKTDTHQLSRRPSSRLAQIFPPRLRQRQSDVSFISTSPELSTQSPSTQTSETSSTVLPAFQQEEIRSLTPSRRSSSSTQTQQALEPDAGDTPNLNRNSHLGSSTTTHQTLPRSFSPSPVPRSISPVPSISQASGRFSIRKLQRIFRKSSFSNISSNDSSRIDQASSIGSAHSTCPSLSSTYTSECSGRTTPTLDSVPQTPTSFDENETRRTIVPLPSCSTIGSGISLGSSFNSGAVSSLSSSNTVSSMSTAATRGSVFSAPVFHPRNATCSQASEQSSMSNILSSVSDGITSSDATRAGISNDTNPPSLPTPSFSEIKLPELDLKLGLGIDLFLNDADNASAGIGSPNYANHRTSTNITRSLSLKNFGSRLRRGREPVPPVPPMPSSSSTHSDKEMEMEMEMKLKSLHFDDISFDAGKFMAF